MSGKLKEIGLLLLVWKGPHPGEKQEMREQN